MRFPQVSERVKEAPAHALRAVFASIGQVLLVTDRMKNKPAEPAEEEKTASPHADEPAAATPSATAEESTTAAESAPAAEAPAALAEAPAAPAAPGAEAPAASVAGPAAPEPVAAEAATEPGGAAATPAATTPAASAPIAAEPAAPEPAVAECAPPIANYEQLTIASLRARLRGLTIVQVRELIVYELAHADRPDVIAMFERRVAKLETPEG